MTRFRPFFLLFWCVLVTWLLYGRSLSLPLFFDDLLQLPYAASHSYRHFWQTAQLAYYRPLNFVIWKLFYDLRGYQDPAFNHALNLALHAANGVLVGALANWRVTSEGRGARSDVALRPSLLSATLYLFYPFSYQGVPWIGSLNHLLAIFLILLSIFTYVKWRAEKRPFWAIFSLLCAFLAPFAHENGVLVGPFVWLWELTSGKWQVASEERGTKGEEREARSDVTLHPSLFALRSLTRSLLWFIPGLIWLLIWWNIPKNSDGGLFINSWEGIWQNSTYFVQGMAYPFTWPGGWLKMRFGWNDVAIVWGLSAIGLGTAVFTHYRTRLSLYPWLWGILAVLPAVIFLKFDYVINGPRLLMLASVGLAWGWGAVVSTQWSVFSEQLAVNSKQFSRFTFHPATSSGQAVLRFSLAAFVIVTLGQNYRFIQERMRLHDMLGSAVFQTIDITKAANAQGKTAVVINFPSWLAPESTYALGHEGVLFWPDYAPHPALVSAHTGQPADLTFVRVEGIRPEMPYFYGLTGTTPDWASLSAQSTELFVAVYTSEQVEILPAGALLPPTLPEAELARFMRPDGKTAVSLLSANVVTEPNHSRIQLRWSAPNPLENVTVFVHLLDTNGQLMAQADGDPIAGTYPFSLWQPGQIVADVRYALTTYPPSAVLVGLYDRATGERLLATFPDGTPLPDNAATIR